MMEAMRSSEMSVLTRATWRHVPEGGVLRGDLVPYRNSTSQRVIRVKMASPWLLLTAKNAVCSPVNPSEAGKEEVVRLK
jgi:hypothetical protein